MSTSEELHQDVSSHSVDTETTDLGKPSEQVATGDTQGMTQEQATAYYNKTQELARERREFEQQRAEWERQNNSQGNQSYTQGNPWANNGYSNQYTNMGQPVQQANPVNQTQQLYNSLVDTYGYEAANTLVQAMQAINQPLQQQLQEANQTVNQLKVEQIKSQINQQGVSKYGEEWNQHQDQIIDYIVKGFNIDQAWWAVTGPNQVQRAKDQAYQEMQQKKAENVASQGSVLNNEGQPQINSVADAFAAAMKDLNG